MPKVIWYTWVRYSFVKLPIIHLLLLHKLGIGQFLLGVAICGRIMDHILWDERVIALPVYLGISKLTRELGRNSSLYDLILVNRASLEILSLAYINVYKRVRLRIETLRILSLLKLILGLISLLLR